MISPIYVLLFVCFLVIILIESAKKFATSLIPETIIPLLFFLDIRIRGFSEHYAEEIISYMFVVNPCRVCRQLVAI